MRDNPVAESLELIERFRRGDEEAARALFEQHGSRLVALVRGRMSARLGRRIDAEDVVQSAFRSFFGHVQQGQYTFEQRGDLWRLLVVIGLNKLRRNIEFHSAGKRGFQREAHLGPQSDTMAEQFEPVAASPPPDAELAVLEEIEQLSEGLDEVQRRVLELRLQGYQLEEIAADVARSERTVRRVMDKIRLRLEQRLLESAED